MPSFASFTSAAGLVALCLTLPAQAGSITGDSFSATMADDSRGAIELNGSTSPVSGIAGSAGVDLLADRLEIEWTDDDTFELRVILGEDLSNLKISLTDLNFKTGLAPVNITGVAFDDANTPQETYNGYQGIVGPGVSFTANSVEVSFDSFPVGPAADAIPWLFHVATSRTTAVPDSLPGTAVWLALGGWVIARRAKSKR